MRVVVLADTHMRPGSSRVLPERVVAELGRADLVLHAGDVVTGHLIEVLAGFAPTHAVLGNNDTGLVGALPETIELELDGVRVAMIHDSGVAKGRERRMRRRFPEADLVVFGHSHIPWDAAGADGQWLFNPGSPTDKRRQPRPTFGVLELDGGVIVRTRVETV